MGVGGQKRDFRTMRITPRREGRQTDCEFFHKLGEMETISVKCACGASRGQNRVKTCHPSYRDRFSFSFWEAAKR